MNKMHWMTLCPLRAPDDLGGGAGDGSPPAGDGASPAGDPPPAGDQGQPSAGETGSSAQPDFSWYPEQFRTDDAPDHSGFQKYFEDLSASDAIRQEQLALVPDDPSGYEFAVPTDLDFGELELPDDFTFQMKADDPAMAPVFEEFGAFLHKNNLPSSASGDLLKILAKYQATEFSQLYSASVAEKKSLGPTANARIASAERAIDARLPPDQAAALKGALTSANAIKAIESLILPRGLQTTDPTPPEPSEKSSLEARYPSSVK